MNPRSKFWCKEVVNHTIAWDIRAVRPLYDPYSPILMLPRDPWPRAVRTHDKIWCREKENPDPCPCDLHSADFTDYYYAYRVIESNVINLQSWSWLYALEKSSVTNILYLSKLELNDSPLRHFDKWSIILILTDHLYTAQISRVNNPY